MSCAQVACELRSSHLQVAHALHTFNSCFTCSIVELTYISKFVMITIMLSVLQV